VLVCPWSSSGSAWRELTLVLAQDPKNAETQNLLNEVERMMPKGM
jgi:hypothetical protein